ncbi:hypothetical protein FXO38_11598 [Capsicum annuum]|nr:hypothetical protein FXO38_11598 [Capsicum annuum]
MKHEDGNPDLWYKARLIVKGFNQKKIVDFNKIFSLVMKMSSIRVVLGLDASLDLEIEQIDVKTAFLHGDLDEEILMEQPEGFKGEGKENYKNKKLWLSQEKYIQKVLQRFNMDKAKVVSTPLAMHFKLSMKQCPSSDDEKEDIKKVPYTSVVGSLMYSMVCTRSDIAHIVGVVSRFLFNLRKEHWNVVKWIMRYLCGTSSLSLCFGTRKPIPYGFTDSDMARKPRSCGYHKRSTFRKYFKGSTWIRLRSDIAHVVGVVSRFLFNPGREHWNAVKWIMRYLCGTSSMSLCFGTRKPILCGFTDSDMASDLDTHKSTSGYLVTFTGGAVSWQSRLQKYVALSTTEAELITAVEACKELIWMKRFLGGTWLCSREIVILYFTPTVREMEQTYMKIFKPYTDEVKDTLIDALKVQLKGVTILTSSVEIVNEDEDLGGHNYVLSPARACDNAGSSGFKTAPDTSNDEDLHKRVTLFEKIILNIASFVRDKKLGRIEKN